MVLPLYAKIFFSWCWNMLSIRWQSFSRAKNQFFQEVLKRVSNIIKSPDPTRQKGSAESKTEETPDLTPETSVFGCRNVCISKTWEVLLDPLIQSVLHFNTIRCNSVLHRSSPLSHGSLDTKERKGMHLFSGVPELMVSQDNVFGKNSKTSS